MALHRHLILGQEYALSRQLLGLHEQEHSVSVALGAQVAREVQSVEKFEGKVVDNLGLVQLVIILYQSLDTFSSFEVVQLVSSIMDFIDIHLLGFLSGGSLGCFVQHLGLRCALDGAAELAEERLPQGILFDDDDLLLGLLHLFKTIT